ncbi:type I glutamate--ammonia ligase [Streptomyces pseudoechinosporeus]
MSDPSTAQQVRQHVERLAAQGIDIVRVTYPDLIGVDRSRDVLLSHLPAACDHGLAFCRAIYVTSPRGDVIDAPGGLEEGLPDISVRPDLDTLVALPWEPGVAWCLGDPIDPATGAPAAESPRDLVRRLTGGLAATGLEAVIGPELEYFLLDPAPGSPTGWARYSGLTGNVYSSGRRGDPESHLLRTLRQLDGLGIGVTSGNQEFDGGQFEINLSHSAALDAADRAFRFKSAVRELARTEGRLATFMAKPFNDSGGSGFHLHVSCEDGDGRNVFDDPAGQYGLSTTARHAIGGLLAHTPALTALLNPTINSYKRFGRDTLAPWLIDWGLDKRSAMLRIPPERGSGARLEMRLGDASANPYLAVAGLVAALHLGIRDAAEPPAPIEGYGYDETRAGRLPQSLDAALDALEADTELTELLGKPFTDTFLAYKRNELTRFQTYVTDWEFGEYAQHI